MSEALIIHGICDEYEFFEMDFPQGSHAHWIPWLQQKLLRSGIECQTPQLPSPYNPIYTDWVTVFERMYHSKIDILIGHSAGAGFLLKWPSENTAVTLNTLVCVAPWIDPDKRFTSFLHGMNIDSTLLKRIKNIHILHSTDDMEDVCKSVKIIQSELPQGSYLFYEDKGHFCLGDLGSEQFPELWDLLFQTI